MIPVRVGGRRIHPAPADCWNLQDAQDEIQRVGVWFFRSEDATGRGRMQIVDRNWLVVGQFPAAGDAFGEWDATLFVVRYGEPNECEGPVDESKVRRMPDVVCWNLQDAQNEIQRTGVWISKSQDASGRGRMQIDDRAWLVVGQFPDPGDAFGEWDATLFVVRYGEPSDC